MRPPVLAVALATLLVVSAPERAHAQPADRWTLPGDMAPDLIHGELATGVVTNAVSLNYERRLTDFMSLRLGYGASVVLASTDTKSAHGPLAMLAFLFFGGPAHLEVALGTSVVTSNKVVHVGGHLGGDWYIVPNIFIGFRWQRPASGPVFRAGFAWTSAYGVPFAGSFGWSF